MRGMNTARMLLALLIFALAACGGGGDDCEECIEKEIVESIAPPPCKSVPVEQRAAECGT